jgi:transcriptional regulator GlxA family with amidase domain
LSKPLPESIRAPTERRLIGFLLVPQFSMIAFASAVEPLRLANRASGRNLYDWRLYSQDGRPVRASNGVLVAADGAFSEARRLSAAFVCAGLDVHRHDHRDLIATLRRLRSFGTAIGALCTGTCVLAKAGLLSGYRATTHWENLPGLAQEFPELDITDELFEIDRNRYTCAGGTSALDMMLSLIARENGREIAAAAADQLIHHRIREPREHQRMDVRMRLGVAHPRVVAVIARMEDTIEAPLSCFELARQVGLSTRQLERLFEKYIGQSPTKYYVGLRLERARDLLRQTCRPILEIALACGFSSASHFSRSFTKHFGQTPSAERRAQHMFRPPVSCEEAARGRFSPQS